MSPSLALVTALARRFTALLTTPFNTPSDALRPEKPLLLLRVGLPSPILLSRRGGGLEVVGFFGESERRVKEEEKSLRVGDEEGGERERDFREETSTGEG